MIHEHALSGCTPTPLASYLKALAVLMEPGKRRGELVAKARALHSLAVHNHLITRFAGFAVRFAARLGPMPCA